MSLLFDLLAEAVLDGLGPEGDRGSLLLGILGGTGICCAIGWLLLVSADPLSSPEWGLFAIACGFIYPLPAILLSIIAVRREKQHLLATLTVLVSLGALTLAISAVL